MARGNSIGLYLLIGLVALARLVPHPWNVTPAGALGLFSGAYVRGPMAWLVPAAALMIGDAVIGFYDPVTMLFVYAGGILGVSIGRYLLFRVRSLARVGGSVFLASTVFYLVSNFGVWLASPAHAYPLTLEGLWLCYVNALPFFGRTLAGNAVYAALLFGLVEGMRHLQARQGENYVQG